MSERPGNGGSERSVLADSVETLFLRLWLTGVGFGASVLISRGLGPEGRGRYYLPVVAAGLLLAFSKLGLEQANVFLFGTCGISVNRLSGQNGLVALVAGSIAVVLLLLAPPVFPALFSDTPVSLLLLAGLTIPFTLHAQFSAGLLTLQGQVTWQFWANLWAGLVQLALLLTLLWFRRFDVAPVLTVNLAYAVVTWGLTVWALGGRRTTWLRWDAGLFQESLRHSLVLHLGMVLFFLHLRLDMLMVKGMVGTTALGLYSLSVVLAETVLLATDSLTIAMLPRQVGNTLSEASTLALRGARINVLLGIVVVFFWAALGMPILRVFFGADFTPAYLPLVGLLPGMVFLGVQRVCGAPALRAGRPGQITAIYAASLFCNGALNLWWIPTWGIVGAALASSVSYGLGAVLFVVWIARMAGVTTSEGFVPRRSDLVYLGHAAVEGLRVVQQSYFVRSTCRKQ